MEDEQSTIITEASPAEVETTTETTEENTTGAEPAEVVETPEEHADESPAAKKENRVQKRIDEITREKYEAKQEAEYWRKVATGEIRPQETLQQPAPAKPAVELPGLPPRPKSEDFEDYEDFVEALGEWSAEKVNVKKEIAAAQKQEQERRQTTFNTYQEKINAAKTKYTDWDDVIAIAPNLVYPQTTVDAIVESDQGADIQYYLCANEAEAARIHKLSPIQQIKEIAKLEVKLLKPSEPPAKRVTQAPQPINAIGGNDAGILDIDKLEGEAWIAAERARVAKLGRRY